MLGIFLETLFAQTEVVTGIAVKVELTLWNGFEASIAGVPGFHALCLILIFYLLFKTVGECLLVLVCFLCFLVLNELLVIFGLNIFAHVFIIVYLTNL